MRSCGPCTACCTVQGVREGLESPKPPGVPCPHLCEKGCGIYKKRPDECSTYRCLWLQGFGELWDRPDLSGVVFEYQDAVETPFILGRLNPGRQVNARVRDLAKALKEGTGLPVGFTNPRPEDGWFGTVEIEDDE